MEVTVWSSAFSFTFATVVIAYVLILVLNWVWFKPKKLEKLLREHGFSGNSYKVFHGDTKEISRVIKEANSKPISLSDDIAPRILPFEHHIISKYGKKSFIWIGPTPRINITDPKLIREILLKHDIFQKPVSNPLSKLIVSGMALYEGEQWFKVRKIANPAFHLNKLKDMLLEVYASCNDMINKWKNLVSNEESSELDVWPHIQTLTADAISRAAFGSSFEEGRKIFELIGAQIKLMIEALQYVYIPGWRFLPTNTNRKVKGNYNKMQELIKGIISKREEAMKIGKGSKDDLLSLLMESNYKEIQQKGTGMSVEEVIEECKLFYVAGQETTSSLLLWTMVLLCLHPHWQERAREEVLKIFENKEPKFDELNKLKVVSNILYEALRLYPPALTLVRKNIKEIKLGEIVLPPGIMISIPIILVHRDHEYWRDDPKEFNPDRFSEGVLKASKNNEAAFFPFSWGPRICIGQNFALMEAKLALAMILQSFSFQLSPTYVHAPVQRINMYPQYGVHMILHKI